MRSSSELYILILNYNSYQETIALFNQVNNIEIAKTIVIDNNSNSKNKTEIKQHIPSDQLLLLNQNQGYAAGNNRGIQKAIDENANAVLILNPDIKIQPEVIIKLYNKLISLSNVGAIGTRICFRNKPEVIYSDGGLIDKERGFYTSHLNYAKPIHEANSKSVNEVDYVNGSVFMVKTETFKKVGMMKESFFLYFEETEWCLRARQMGLKLYIDTSLKAYHLSSAKNSRYHFYMTRNRLWLAKLYPEYYKITRQIIGRQLFNKFKKNIKKQKLRDKVLYAKLKGYIYGIINHPT